MGYDIRIPRATKYSRTKLHDSKNEDQFDSGTFFFFFFFFFFFLMRVNAVMNTA